MKKLLKNKKGILGLNTTTQFIVTLLVLAVTAFAVIIALAALDDTNVLTDGSIADNQTTAILNNVSTGISSFFGNATTWFSLLAIVVILLIIAIVIVTVRRFEVGAGAGTSL